MMAKTLIEEILEIFAIKEQIIAPERIRVLKQRLEAYLREAFNREVDDFTSLPALLVFAEKVEKVQQYFPDLAEDFKQSTERKIWDKALLILSITGPVITAADILPALHYYAVRNDADKLQVLLKRRPMDVDALSDSFNYALRCGYKEVAAVILAAGKGLVDSNGMTPLIRLCRVATEIQDGKKDAKEKLLTLPEQIHLLIDLGVDINAADKQGKTALHFAASKDKDDLVDILLKRGACREKRDYIGLTPLQLAIMHNRIGIIMRFLQDTPDGPKYIRHWAAHHGYFEILQHLRDWPEPNLKDSGACTPFLKAVQAGQLKCAEYLYGYPEIRKDIQHCDNSGLSAVHWAVRNRHLKVFNWLASLPEVDLSLKDKSGKDCLAHALEMNDVQLIQVVYLAKVDRHCLTEQDINNVLHWAYKNQNHEIIEYFLKFIVVSKEKFSLLEKASDCVAMQQDVAEIAKLAREIFQRLQILAIDQLSAEQAMELLRGLTPRQLAEIRRVNKSVYALIEEEKFINPLVNAYGLRVEYDAECAKPGADKHSRFAKFYRVYLQTWLRPERPSLTLSRLAEELTHAIALRQTDRIKFLLPSQAQDFSPATHFYAFPFRLAVRLGEDKYITLLQKHQAKSLIVRRNEQGQDVVDYAYLPSVEAARANHRHLVMQFLDQQSPNFKRELGAVVSAAVECGHQALLKELIALPFDGELDITEALLLALRHGHTQIFEWLKAKNQANSQRYTIDQNALEEVINEAIRNKENTLVCHLLCQLTPFLLNLERKLRWAIDHKQPEAIRAILKAHPQWITSSHFYYVTGRGDAACLAVFLEHMQLNPRPGYAWYERLVRQFIISSLEFKREGMAGMLLQYWQAHYGSLFNSATGENSYVMPILAQKVAVITKEDVNLNSYGKIQCASTLLQECADWLMHHEKFLKQVPRPAQEPEDEIAMLALLKQGIAQLQKQKKPNLELAMATYLLITNLVDDRLSLEQKQNLIQVYEVYVKPWWQTAAKALVCIISGAIGLVLGAAAGIGIGMLAGSWSGPGMALTALAGAITGGVQGATLGVAAGVAVTGLVVGTAGLLAAKGLFKTPEQQLAEAVKLQLDKHKPRLT